MGVNITVYMKNKQGDQYTELIKKSYKQEENPIEKMAIHNKKKTKTNKHLKRYSTLLLIREMQTNKNSDISL